MLKKDLLELVEKQEEEIKQLKEIPNAIPELEARVQRLESENERLREYCTMANEESATMTHEVHRLTTKLNQSFEDQLNLIKAIESANAMASKLLQLAMEEEQKVNNYITNRKKGRE